LIILECRLSKDPIELLQAMHGYNPFLADNMHPEGDPGIRNGQIFEFVCKHINYQKLTKGHLDFVNVKSDVKCDSSMVTETFK
jgi:hypothetical protein